MKQTRYGLCARLSMKIMVLMGMTSNSFSLYAAVSFNLFEKEEPQLHVDGVLMPWQQGSVRQFFSIDEV